MSDLIFKYFPYELILIIISYDNRFAIRNGKIMNRLDFSKNNFSKLIDMYSILSFAYYSRNDELEEDLVIELPINDYKLYIIQCCVFQNEDEENKKEVNRFIFLEEMENQEKILTIY